MRGPTSSTVISISCCSPRSIVRCSGSVRSRGGISPGWRNWPRLSATQGRSRLSRTGCLTPRFCSIWCSTSGGRRWVSKWQGPARYAPAWSAFSLRPRRPQNWGGGNELAQRQSSCRWSSFLPAQSPTARPWCRRRRSTARPMRRPQCASPNRFPSTHWVERRSSPFFAMATISSGRSAGSESSDWQRRVTESTPTQRRLARSPWPSVMNGSLSARCLARMAATSTPPGSPNWRRKASRPIPVCSIHTSAGTSSEQTACSLSPGMVSGSRSGRPDGRNSRLRPMAPMPLPATMTISLFSCATDRQR